VVSLSLSLLTEYTHLVLVFVFGSKLNSVTSNFFPLTTSMIAIMMKLIKEAEVEISVRECCRKNPSGVPK